MAQTQPPTPLKDTEELVMVPPQVGQQPSLVLQLTQPAPVPVKLGEVPATVSSN